jgi:nucleotide-binding universal stress UspA family protein
MKTIILATDFSPAAVNAANYAANMALAINADLLLLHVFQLSINYYAVPIEITEQEMKEESQHNLNVLKNDLLKITGNKLVINTEVVNNHFFDGLAEACERILPYAVIMGSQGTTATERFFFGGHAVYAMQHLQWPLITVPIGTTFSSIKRIGLACDFDRAALTTPVEEVITLVKEFKAELHILNVDSEESFDPDMIFESNLLKKMLLPLHPIYHLSNAENINEAIMDFSEKQNINLLIVVPKQHRLLEKLLTSSHTKQLVLHCHVPVAALHSLIY